MTWWFVSFPALLLLGSAFFGLARIARVATQAVRFARVGAQSGRTVGQAQRVFTRRSLRWVFPLALVVMVFAALFVWRFEAARQGASEHGLGDALWWAMATLMTVGYGDVAPTTAEGRIAAVILMLVGITVVGWLTAALASLFVGNDGTAVDAELHRKLDEMAKRLAAIEAHLGVVAEEGTSITAGDVKSSTDNRVDDGRPTT